MTANHADGCPAIVDPRTGCSCLLRGVAARSWEPGDPCPGCRQRPCVCVTISLPKETSDE